jgi:hypothetical protein
MVPDSKGDRMSKLPDTTHIRGMSEPMGFHFNLDDCGGKMKKNPILVTHAVIFTSFIQHGDASCNLATMDGDPRMAHFVKYIWDNFLNEYKEKMVADLSAKAMAKVDELISEMEERRKRLAELEEIVAKLKAQYESDEPKQTN